MQVDASGCWGDELVDKTVNQLQLVQKKFIINNIQIHEVDIKMSHVQ